MDTKKAPSRIIANRHTANVRFRSIYSPRWRSHVFLLVEICACALGARSLAWGGATDTVPAALVAAVTGKDTGLNGTRMVPGATLFPGDRVRVGEDSTTALRFGPSEVLAAPNTELIVKSEGLTLRGGRIQVRAGGEKRFEISGAMFRLALMAHDGAPGSAEIRVEGARAQISAVSGTAELAAKGSDVPYRLRPGETASLEAGDENASPQNPAGPEAGKIARLLQKVQIDRASQTLLAAASESVYWNDNLHSDSSGRAHVTLNDGSLLSLGSNSSLRIIQHDAQAQQTTLDLVFGRLRAKVTKLTQPGGNFQIRTPVGVAGLVGTDVSLLVTNDFVELLVTEGAARFLMLNGQSVSVPAGRILRVSRAGVLAAPRLATHNEIQTAQNETDITGQNQTASNDKGKNKAPVILISVGTGATVIGVSAYLNTRQMITPVIPGR